MPRAAGSRVNNAIDWIVNSAGVLTGYRVAGSTDDVTLAGFNAAGTALVDPTGTNIYGYATLPRDISGNAVANIIPRTGELASLLGIAGGAGEVSVATDKRSLVLHNGVVGGAKAFHRGAYATAIVVPGAAAIPSGATGSVMDLGLVTDSAEILGNDGIIIANEIVIPLNGASGLLSGVINMEFLFGASALGTFRRVELQAKTGPGVWLSVIVKSIPAAASARFTWFTTFILALPGDSDKYRFLVQQDSGAAMDLGDGSMSVELFGM